MPRDDDKTEPRVDAGKVLGSVQASEEPQLFPARKGPQVPTDFKPGIFRCIHRVSVGLHTYEPGEVVKLSADQAYPIRDSLVRL